MRTWNTIVPAYKEWVHGYNMETNVGQLLSVLEAYQRRQSKMNTDDPEDG